MVCGVPDMNPVHNKYPYKCFLKPFYVRFINNHVHDTLFPYGIRCLHAVFNPIDDDTFLFLFSGIIGTENDADGSGITETFHGTMKRKDKHSTCYTMMVSDFYKNFSLCMENINDEYNYMYVTDKKGRTGFGMVDSLHHLSHNDAIFSIMDEKTSGDFHEVNHTGCAVHNTSLQQCTP
jgi:hypothetical protein